MGHRSMITTCKEANKEHIWMWKSSISNSINTSFQSMVSSDQKVLNME